MSPGWSSGWRGLGPRHCGELVEPARESAAWPWATHVSSPGPCFLTCLIGRGDHLYPADPPRKSVEMPPWFFLRGSPKNEARPLCSTTPLQ